MALSKKEKKAFVEVLSKEIAEPDSYTYVGGISSLDRGFNIAEYLSDKSNKNAILSPDAPLLDLKQVSKDAMKILRHRNHSLLVRMINVKSGREPTIRTLLRNILLGHNKLNSFLKLLPVKSRKRWLKEYMPVLYKQMLLDSQEKADKEESTKEQREKRYEENELRWNELKAELARLAKKEDFWKKLFANKEKAEYFIALGNADDIVSDTFGKPVMQKIAQTLGRQYKFNKHLSDQVYLNEDGTANDVLKEQIVKLRHPNFSPEEVKEEMEKLDETSVLKDYERGEQEKAASDIAGMNLNKFLRVLQLDAPVEEKVGKQTKGLGDFVDKYLEEKKSTAEMDDMDDFADDTVEKKSTAEMDDMDDFADDAIEKKSTAEMDDMDDFADDTVEKKSTAEMDDMDDFADDAVEKKKSTAEMDDMDDFADDTVEKKRSTAEMDDMDDFADAAKKKKDMKIDTILDALEKGVAANAVSQALGHENMKKEVLADPKNAGKEFSDQEMRKEIRARRKEIIQNNALPMNELVSNHARLSARRNLPEITHGVEDYPLIKPEHYFAEGRCKVKTPDGRIGEKGRLEAERQMQDAIALHEFIDQHMKICASRLQEQFAHKDVPAKLKDVAGKLNNIDEMDIDDFARVVEDLHNLTHEARSGLQLDNKTFDMITKMDRELRAADSSMKQLQEQLSSKDVRKEIIQKHINEEIPSLRDVSTRYNTGQNKPGH